MPITDQELAHYDQLGLIPGPSEEESTFLNRIKYCLALKETLTKKSNGQLPLPETDAVTDPLLKEGLYHAKKHYGISPHWIPLILSNEKLAPWHGGCAWIFQWEKDSPLGALLQLRKGWQTKKQMFGLYKRGEVIGHELAHVGRMAFEEPHYEELLAFQSSSSWMHRTLGPIVESSSESMVLFLAFFLLLLGDLFFIFTGAFDFYAKTQWLKLIPFTLIGYWGCRLWLRRRCQSLCRTALIQTIKDPQKAKWLLYRLTDEEIHTIGKMSPKEVHSFATQSKGKSLRWRLLYTQYF